jgi:hypothetical protein
LSVTSTTTSARPPLRLASGGGGILHGGVDGQARAELGGRRQPVGIARANPVTITNPAPA